MDTLNFLQRVLPTEGFYVTTVINNNQPTRQGFFSKVEDLAKAIIESDRKGNNTYYAISSFIEKGSRKQKNVQSTKVLALDVDCGDDKPFPSWREGLIALADFVEAVGLPKPMVVHSGNGLHVYWVLDTELLPHQWKPLAGAMKAATQDKNFAVDPAVPADSARVLRPVGTTNPKSGTQVKLLIDAAPVGVETMLTALGGYITAVPSREASPLAQALAVTNDMPPAVGGVVAVKCGQIGWGVKNQPKIDEPFWYAMMGVAAFCEDSDAVAISWSENHPEFDAAETLRKVGHWKNSATGPTTCNKFYDLRPSGCKGCKYKDKVGSPARLGAKYQAVTVSDEAPPSAATDVDLPRGYKRTQRGIVQTIDETDIEVAPFDIYPSSYGRDESLKYEVVRFHWHRKHVGWQDLILRQADLTNARLKDFTTNIADQGIVLHTEKQTGNFQTMLRSYMDELRQKKAMTNLYTTMGWKENFSQFVIGDTVLRRNADGTVSEESITLSATSHRLGSELWRSEGTLEAWVDFTQLLDKTNLMAHMFAIGISMSAPLYAFTGLRGLTVSLYGPTGGGKTLAQYWQQSIWGDPEKLHFGAKFTQNTLFSRMGLYCHLPITIDEATMVDDKEVGDFLYWVSQGRDKARLNRSSEEKESKVWASPTTISTNRSWQAKLLVSGNDTDAQAARLLELNVPVHPMFYKNSEAGRRVYNFLHTNYGHAGRVFIANLLALGPEGVRATIAEATSTFHKRYKSSFSGAERYWEQAIILADLSLKLATEWNLIKFDYTKGIEWALSQLGAIRRTVAEARLDAHDLLSEYLAEHADMQVQVFHTGTQKPTMDYSRVPRNELRVRFDFYRKSAADTVTNGTVMFDRIHFRRWLAHRGMDYRAFMEDLKAENVLATPKSNKAYLAKDTPIKLGQSYVIAVNLNHPRTMGILTDADQAIEDMVYGQLQVVQ